MIVDIEGAAKIRTDDLGMRFRTWEPYEGPESRRVSPESDETDREVA
jgi:hypothetical protein